jgi:glycosyltransferase involved in cell wall biosynthesis
MYIVFPTFEIAPINKGGLAQYIYTIIQNLQSKYIPLIILYSLPLKDAAKARQHFETTNLTCEIYHVNELSAIQLESEDVYNVEKTSLALLKSLEYLMVRKEIAGVEWCDHAGSGYATLQDKHCNPQSVFTNVPMWVHLHGTREVCDLIDRLPAALNSSKGYVLSSYAERLCLELADAWKSPSQAIADWYTDYFGIQNQVFISPLPYRKIAEQGLYYQKLPPEFPIKILCPGRIQYLKGSDIVVRAGVELCKMFPNQFHITFAGHNYPTANTNFNSSLEELKSFIPKEFISHFSFSGKYSAEEYLQLAQNSHLAVFASRVETFCLAAHELNWISIPLVLADIPAFKDHFHHGVNCYKFDATVESLTLLLAQILKHPAMIAKIESQPVKEFDVTIFEQLTTLPAISKNNANYVLFTKLENSYLNKDRLNSVNFKDLSVHSFKDLVMAGAWKVMKRSAERLSISEEIKAPIKRLLKKTSNL